jgi:hypothetical protein
MHSYLTQRRTLSVLVFMAACTEPTPKEASDTSTPARPSDTGGLDTGTRPDSGTDQDSGLDTDSGGTDTGTAPPPESTSVEEYAHLLPHDEPICDGVSDGSIAIGCAFMDHANWRDRRLSFPEEATCMVGDGFWRAIYAERCFDTPSLELCGELEPIEPGTTCGAEVQWPDQLLGIIGAEGDVDAPFQLLGNGATLLAEPGLPVESGTGLLKVRDAVFLEIHNLNFDGNRDTREPWEVNAHNLKLQHCVDCALYDVATSNAVCDGLYVSAADHTDPDTFSTRVVITDMRATNAFRNNVSIINCTDCGLYGGELIGANGTDPEAGIDLEPNSGSAEPGIENFTISGVHIEDNEGRCIQLTSVGAPTGTVVEGNTLVNCRKDTATCGAGIVVGHPATIEGNTFRDFDLTCRALIDFLAQPTSRDSVFRNNTIVDIRLTDTDQHVFYFHSINGGGHLVEDNILMDVSATAEGGWCTERNLESTTLVQNNTIDGEMQSPNPGCD